MLRYLPKRAASICVQSLPGQVPHSVFTHSTLVGQHHSSRVRDLEALHRHITLTPYLPYIH